MSARPTSHAEVALDPDAVETRLEGVRERIRSTGVDPADVVIVAVTKGFPGDAAAIASSLGLADVGENYAQELRAKAEELRQRGVEGLRWHFIGALQTNKVRQVAPIVSCVQSVDRESLVDELGRRAAGVGVLLQVNTTDEPQKAGCRPEDVGPLLERARNRGLVVEGLMTIGPTEQGASPTPAFRALRRLVDEHELKVCSMGMTDDLEQAVTEGSTMVRLGRALFGPRPRRAAPKATM